MKVHRGLNQRWENAHFCKLYKKIQMPRALEAEALEFPKCPYTSASVLVTSGCRQELGSGTQVLVF